ISIASVRPIRARATPVRQRSFALRRPRLIRCHNLLSLSSAPGRPKRNPQRSSLKWEAAPRSIRRRFTIRDLGFTIHLMNNSWPELKFSEWQDTLATLHMWMQVVGKIRLEQTPLVNHWWNVPLYVSPRGLTTSAMPYQERIFEIEFDFIDHQLLIKCSDGSTTTLPLRPQSVADFYAEVMSALRGLGMEIKIWTVPVEIPNPIRFEEDTMHAAYDSEYANRFWRVIVKMDEVLKE